MRVHILYGVLWNDSENFKTIGVYSTYRKALEAGDKWFHEYSEWKVSQDLRLDKIRDLHIKNPELKNLMWPKLEPIVNAYAGPCFPIPERVWGHDYDRLEIAEMEVDSE